MFRRWLRQIGALARGWAGRGGWVGLIASLGLAACQAIGPTAAPVVVTVVVRETQPVVVTATLGPAAPTAAPTPEPAAPKRLVICVLQEPESLNPFVSALPVTQAVNQALFDGLIDSRLYQYQPVAFVKLPTLADGDAALAAVEVGLGDRVFDAATNQAVTIGPGSRLLLFQPGGEAVEADFSVISTTTAVQQTAQWTQVENMTWEDGAPVTSADALLAFAVASSPAAPVQPDFARFAAAYEALDDRTVRWTGLPGYASPTYYLHHAGFLPQHAYANLSPADVLADARANRDPLAYGPFKLDEWVAGDHLTLSRNPSYWRAVDGLPHLDELVIRFVPDTDQILAQVASGRCDLAPQDSAYADQFPLIRQLEAEGLLESQMVADTVFDQLAFNALPAESYTGFAAQPLAADGGPAFSDPRVRRGLAHCLDRAALVAQGLGGAGLVPQTYAPPDHPLYAGDENVPIYNFDPVQGRALLAEAGWTDTNSDGVLDNGAGQDFRFVLSARSSARRQVVMPLIQDQLRNNCQVEASVELYGSEYTNPGPDGVVLGRRFDASQLTFRSGAEPPCSLYTSTSIPNDANGWEVFNIAGFSNPDFDAACLAAYEAADPAEKAARHAEAQRLWAEALPAIVLYTPARLLLSRPGVANVLPDPTANSDLWNVENFDLAP